MSDRFVMGETRVTSAGQITLLRLVMKKIGAKEGDKVRFVLEGGRVYVERAEQ
jgi:bifunctional DNA-binding transcriptional regulator/antitoxin component of YhaV-PrlF toxin-antitoxin module